MDAYERIRKYQSGELLPARTDTLILTRRCWEGSTHNMRWLSAPKFRSRQVLFGAEDHEQCDECQYQSQADDYVWLRCEFEMNPEDLMLRSLSKKMGRDIQDILLNEMSDEEIKKCRNVLRRKTPAE